MEIRCGHTLRALRKATGLSQDKLSYASDVDRSYISEIERDIRTPSVKTIFKLAKALDVAPEEIIRLIRIDNQVDSSEV